MNNTNININTKVLFSVLLVFLCCVTSYWYFQNRCAKNAQSQIQQQSQPQLSSATKEEFVQFTPAGFHRVREGYYVIRKTNTQKYCSNTDNGIICNRDMAGPDEIFFIIHLGQGQYALQNPNTGLWLSLTTTGVNSTSPVVSDYEVFNIKHVRGREYLIQNNKTKTTCTDLGEGLICDDRCCLYQDSFQTFQLIPVHYENIR